ncbi:hypothetical protein M5362_01360 [Streptomyces sp. Je 1-79]|uniref:hypothetical protein n=1 Tax=Streptomyces sp. Je 1-79 TaxID=2943847 RepID=UPI0021A7927D|nr:hypothetical protein [Streptomyces sp. Je 1-79]MCT4351781.1 hypothetical protein [Streptomyces sp. Je 1-79]
MTYPHAPRTPHPSRPPRPGLSFAVVNAVVFAVHVLLLCSAPDVMAVPRWGETGLGVPALLLQGVLLVWTAARYDRRADESRTDGRHTAHGER